ncbi:MAG TPA: Gfo/Idh/MocA family oxidoreductase [Dehalococcoidia bacterium]|nr:Gfo/Idh/MocA family oxidoreductase [Dehalococcoidia bacterium]
MPKPLRVGLVGAGPWAKLVHAPQIAAGPETALTGIWARRSEAAEELARPFGAPAFVRIEALFDACEAVAFSVPPAVQAELAIAAARAGKALLLEKPIAADLHGAETLAAAVERAGVPSLVALTWRFAPAVRRFLGQASTFSAHGGRGWFVSGAFLGGHFATPWRLERGPLLDLGPHVLDLLDAALGPIERLQAHGDLHHWVGLLLDHAGGAHSEVSLCATARIEPSTAGAELYGPDGALRFDSAEVDSRATFATLYREFAAVARGELPSGLDVKRGLYLQRLIEQAEIELRGG